jgi:hypothetical protein
MLPAVSSELLINGQPLDDHAEQIVDALRDTLPALVTLIDLDEGREHVRMATRWYARRELVGTPSARVLDRLRVGEEAFVRVNRRWILRLRPRRRPPADELPLHLVGEVQRVEPSADAMTMGRWAAEKLARYLPRDKGLFDTPPPVRGRGVHRAGGMFWFRRNKLSGS